MPRRRRLLALAAITLALPSLARSQVDGASWEAYAVRYATLESFPVAGLIAGADTARRMDIAMMLWVLRGDARVVLVDAGFYRDRFLERWKPADYIRPSAALAAIGIRPEDVTDVIVTHVHWDHADGVDLFPNARVWIQAEEYRHHVGPNGEAIGQPQITPEVAAMLASIQRAGRLMLVDGSDREILPGITVYTGGKHTFASQYVGVRIASGTAVIASDNLYLYENLDPPRRYRTDPRRVLQPPRPGTHAAGVVGPPADRAGTRPGGLRAIPARRPRCGQDPIAPQPPSPPGPPLVSPIQFGTARRRLPWRLNAPAGRIPSPPTKPPVGRTRTLSKEDATMRCLLLSTLSLSLVLACAPPAEEPPAPPAVDTAAVEQGIADLWNRVVFADTSGDAATMVGLYTETARVDVRGFPPMIGRAAIDTTLRAVFAEYDYTDMRIMPSTTVVLSNELAHQDGTFLETYSQRGKAPMTDYGRYATAVVKGADGQWRFAYFIGFVDSTVAQR